MKNILTFLGVILPLFAFSQSWELGLSAKAANYQGDLVLPTFSTKETNYAFGAFIRRNFNEHLGLRLGADLGKLSGDDANFTERVGRGASFTSNFTELAAKLEYSPWAVEKKSGKIRKVRPYVFGGVGYYLGNPKLSYKTATTASAADRSKDVADLEKNSLSIPLGLGLRFRLTDRVNLELEGSAHKTFFDYIDGVSQAGDPEDNDTYAMAGLNLAFSLGKAKDSDGDGIADKKDSCPEVPGVAENMGCPADRDKDGVYDKDDKCPDVMGVAANMGCPADRDKDGVYDKDDKCPDVAGVAANMGCPSDRDKDGIVDADDKCPDVAGIAANKGCPADRDGDGVYDTDDKCPDVKGVASNKGCPSDRDGDGIVDTDDLCPDLAGVAANKGCPTDRDGDGVYDKDDKCPDVKGLKSNGGCPEMKVEDKKVLDLAVKNINFETNKAVITKESFKILDQVADILTRYNYYSVAIDGHTDSQGDDASNLTLSKNRATACYDYLVKKGIAASRMTHEGYGETRPIAKNDTAEGRRQNRRVEFNLSVK